MTIKTSGPLSLSEIAAEFGGTAPHSLSEYYAGGAYVQAGASGINGPIPSSGAISISHFYGASAAWSGTMTAGRFTQQGDGKTTITLSVSGLSPPYSIGSATNTNGELNGKACSLDVLNIVNFNYNDFTTGALSLSLRYNHASVTLVENDFNQLVIGSRTFSRGQAGPGGGGYAFGGVEDQGDGTSLINWQWGFNGGTTYNETHFANATNYAYQIT